MDKYDTHSLATTERSLDVLELIRELGGATLAEIADEMDVAKSTAHKHVVTLKRKGYIVKEEGYYQTGLKFLHFSEYARTRKQSYRFISQKVSQLAEETGGEVDFIAESDGKGITVYEAYDPDNPYYDISGGAEDNYWRAGTYYYLHTIATGKAILSTYSENRVDAIIDKWGLPASTENTITSRDELFTELTRIREQGYSISNEEYTEGLSAIAQSVLNPDGTTLGAFGISVPTYRMREQTFEERLREKLEMVVSECEAKFQEG